MTLRSWLFVPGDSERKQARAAASPADAIILDLEDSVAPQRLGVARELVARALAARRDRVGQRVWVRVNGPASGELLDDLAAVMPGAPDGIVLPKCSTAQAMTQVHDYLCALERRERLTLNSTGLLVIATETPQAVLTLGGYAGSWPRLSGLTWGAEDLGAALGARNRYDLEGSLTPPFALARSLCLIAAAAAGVQAVDGVFGDFNDAEGLTRELAAARRDGFTGKLAIHPAQLEAINEAFTPSEAELAHARRIVAAFAAAPDVGVTSVDGRMIDRPHLAAAQRVLAAAERFARK
jgi:citrate lyase subunit beta / citryl-CoA lyase